MAVLWQVEDEAERVLRARRSFRDHLQAIAAPPSDVDAAELIYGELVANTVRYARGAVEVRLERVDDDPVLVVRDHGPGPEPRAGSRPPVTDGHGEHGLFAESGRGLAIVERLARRLAVDPAEGGGTVVRAVLPVTARRSE